ncbi:hypothetical protein [Polymorphospora sp. NPDC050346]|uniref:hypothetical protein n=1 Tax=Polymorphospora sp. NPDC050346 TaxID=3155780 RepID=UPI0033D4825D
MRGQPSVLGAAEVARIAADLTEPGPDADGAVGELAEAVADDERNIGGFLVTAAREGRALVRAVT